MTRWCICGSDDRFLADLAGMRALRVIRSKIMRSSGGHPAFRQHCDGVAADGYRKLALA